MSETTELSWGETPFDRMSPEELLLTVKRLYAALIANYSNTRGQRISNPASPYWGPEGSGGIALEMARQIIEPLEEAYGGEEIYRCFYRYANDLLFDQEPGYRIGMGWTVCETCNGMFGANGEGRTLSGEKCRFPGCEGILRELEWKDLKRSDA